MLGLQKLLFAALVFSVFSFGSATTAQADTVVFDFEGPVFTSGGSSHPGAFFGLAQPQPGLTAIFLRPGGGRFDLYNSTGAGFSTEADFGTISLDPFTQVFGSNPTTAFVVNFSQSVTDISIDMGDFSQDADSLLLEAFSGANGTGTLLATATGSLAASAPGSPVVFSFATLMLSASGINSIRFIGGSAGQNNVYYDNLTVTFTPETNPVPEPATLVLLSTGLAGMVGAARRRRR